MKGERHNKILELIQQHAIDRQEDLLRYAASTGHEPIYIDLPDPRNEE